MSVRIQLDSPPAFYTNLGFITGHVILNLTSDENISAIHVKLEGESRTMLMRPMVPPGQAHLYANRAGVRHVPVMENHKVLYRVEQVFPAQNQGGVGATSLGMAYSLSAGSHSYPFRFKIPFNNGCADPSQQAQMGAGGGGFGLGGLQQMQYRHVKKTLPPSLTGFPGEAEIRYYVKVTVQRPSIFKENRRSAIGFRFMPIEPPRAPKSTNETFARRPFAFQPGAMAHSKKSSGGMFAKKKQEVKLSETPPKGEVDARLPSPAILTCNQPIPLRILVKKTTQSPESLYLTNLQIDLIGTTEVRAADVVRKEMSHWVLVNAVNLTREIGKIDDAVGNEIVIDGAELWERVSLPNTVAPSFDTCNIDRKYEVEVKVGLGYGIAGEIQPQNITLPLRFPVTINSGISPPAALLDAMASRPSPIPPNVPSRPPGHPLHNNASYASSSSTPIRPPQTTQQQQQHDPLYPPQLAPGQQPDDMPPSYEDAMADQVGVVVDGGGREYSGITDVDAPDLQAGGAGGGKRRG